MADIAAFIDRHRKLLEKERCAEIEQSSLLLSHCSSKLLEQKGLALTGLGVVNINIGLGGKSLVELERLSAYHTSSNFPSHTFRPGDLARIEVNVSTTTTSKSSGKRKNNATQDTEKSGVDGVVYKVTEMRIVIAIDPSKHSSDEFELPDRCRLIKIANNVTYDRMGKTLDILEQNVAPGMGSKDSTSEVTRLTQVLLGVVPPSSRQTLSDLHFFDGHLNQSQKDAVRFALESPEVACIHGPPGEATGTGKTHTLIEIIRQILSPENSGSRFNQPSRHKRILVCGASNLSVDNILERLLLIPNSSQGSLRCTRLGHPARVTGSDRVLEATLDAQASRSDQAELAQDVKNELEMTIRLLSGKYKGSKGKIPRGAERKKLWEEVKLLRKEYRRRESSVVMSVLSQAQIVLATCHSAGGRQLNGMRFDVVIIDEATQALEAACWIPILKGEKLILAGDPMQLPPTILSLGSDKKKERKTMSTDTGSTSPTIERLRVKTDLTTDRLFKNDSDESNGESDSVSCSPSMSMTEEGERTTGHKHLEKAAIRIREVRTILRPPRSLEVTLFERLEKTYGARIKRMLKVQYRMHNDICAFPTEALYSSQLRSDNSVATHLLQDLPNVTSVGSEEDLEDLRTPIVFYDTAGCEYFETVDGDGDDGSKRNENEAMVVKAWVARLASAGVLPSQIAIITPYQAQVALLSVLLRPTYGTALEIGTVDGMQGREKEAIIISLVRSNNKREVGFLNEKRRLNVAMTRARRHLCIVGDSSTVQHGSKYLKRWMDWLESHADVRYGGHNE